jgi:hypothetical protein
MMLSDAAWSTAEGSIALSTRVMSSLDLHCLCREPLELWAATALLQFMQKRAMAIEHIGPVLYRPGRGSSFHSTTFTVVSVKFCKMVAGDAGLVGVEPHIAQAPATLTREGVECPAMRGDDGRLYTLAGDIGRFGPGDRVRVRGQRADASICQQGTTIEVERIRSAG